MIKNLPIQTVYDLSLQSEPEMMAGYLAGLRGEDESESDFSRSYWHGWRNGMVDSGRREKDSSQAQLAHEYVQKRAIKSNCQ